VITGLIAEFIGTFALIFVGAGAICADALSGGKLGITGIALAHGLTIMAMAYALGHISGGHFNPAVTIAMLVNKRIKLQNALAYVVVQLAGASLAALLLKSVAPSLADAAPYLGACDLNGISAGVGVLVEAVLTFFLVMVIWGTAVDGRSPKAMAPLAIGFTITLDILMGGYFTGAALNPARAFGPALVTCHWANQCVYWIGPILGAIAAGLLGEKVFLKSK